MSVTKKGKTYYLTFRPFGKLIFVKTDAGTRGEARLIEMAITTACRSGDYRSLTPAARAVCVRMFENQGWELPEDLGGKKPQEELVLWRAVELFVHYPGVQGSSRLHRYEICLAHLVDYFAKDYPVKSIWVPEIKAYVAKRQQQGASPSTINWEKGTLSKVFQVLVEMRHIESNPVRLVKNLSQKSEERQVYLGLKTVQEVAAKCPAWYQPIVWTAFYTGMRRGEILGLTRKRVNLPKRMIYLGPEDTKEGHWKRVPIHKDLVPILQAVLQGPALLSGKVFTLRYGEGVRELRLETFKNPWERACTALEMEEPLPRFHDLRHTWRTNARRSGVDPQIAESIMGHWFKGKSVNDRYGYISDEELLKAVDKMTFDHGETQIVAVAKPRKKRVRKMLEKPGVQEKRSCGNMT